MSTMAIKRTDFIDSFTSMTEKVGKLGNKEVTRYIPAAHSGMSKVKIAGIIAAIIFVASIVMWAVGASTGVVGLEIAGKIIFGLSISAILLLIIVSVGACFLCKDTISKAIDS